MKIFDYILLAVVVPWILIQWCSLLSIPAVYWDMKLVKITWSFYLPYLGILFILYRVLGRQSLGGTMRKGMWVRICSQKDKNYLHLVYVNQSLGYQVAEVDGEYFVLILTD